MLRRSDSTDADYGCDGQLQYRWHHYSDDRSDRASATGDISRDDRGQNNDVQHHGDIAWLFLNNRTFHRDVWQAGVRRASLRLTRRSSEMVESVMMSMPQASGPAGLLLLRELLPGHFRQYFLDLSRQ